MQGKRALTWIAAGIFLAGFLYDIGLQTLFRPLALRGVYFHPWSSEVMMQTVPIEDLRADPLTSLTYIHIQPPGFDFLRAAFAQLWPALEIHEVLRRVDASLYILWALLLGCMASLIFLWVSRLAGVAPGILSAFFFLLHPAAIYYATFLDSTFLSAFLILWLYYLLWRAKGGASVSVVLIALVALALFFVRSIFQLPALGVLALSLLLLGIPRRQVLVFAVLTGAVSCLFLAKQYYLFHTFSTSSFSGYNLANSVGAGWDAATFSAYLPEQQNLGARYGKLPDVLMRKTKLDGLRNFNNIAYLQLNAMFMEKFQTRLLTWSPASLVRNYLENAAIYFQPSSTYRAGNVIVDRLPWRDVYDAIFSAPVLPVLLLLGAITGVWGMRERGGVRQAAGLMLPGIYILLASVLFEKSENMRFKFWLEPVMYIFLITQISHIVSKLRHRILAPTV